MLISLTFSLLSFSSFSDKDKKGTISVIVKSDLESVTNASFSGLYNLWKGSDKSDKGSNKSIVFSKEVFHNELLTINVNGVEGSTNVYLAKGDSLLLSVKDKKIVIEGSSIAARQNRLLQDMKEIKNKLFRYYSSLSRSQSKLSGQEKGKATAATNPELFYKQLDGMLTLFKQKNSDSSESFIRFVEMDNRYFRVKNELQMPNYNSKTYHQFTPENIVTLNKCLKDSKYSEAILSLYYRQVLSAYIDYLRIKDPKGLLADGKQWMLNEVKVADYVPDPLVREYVVTENLIALWENFGKQPQYLEIVKNYTGQWSSFIIEKTNGLRGKAGAKVYDKAVDYPVLEGIDTAGKKVALADFKGKWLFIDLWATWCGPCNFEMPYLDELEHSLKDYNVAFVGISVDKDSDREKLLQLIKTKNMGGVQIQISDAKKVYSQLAVNSGIPHFAIISPDGKLFLNNVPRPSSGIPDRLLKALAGPKGKGL